MKKSGFVRSLIFFAYNPKTRSLIGGQYAPSQEPANLCMNAFPITSDETASSIG